MSADVHLTWWAMPRLDADNLMNAGVTWNAQMSMLVPLTLLLPARGVRTLAILPYARKMPAAKPFSTSLSAHVQQNIGVIPQIQILVVTRWNVRVVKIVQETWLVTRRTSDVLILALVSHVERELVVLKTIPQFATASLDLNPRMVSVLMWMNVHSPILATKLPLAKILQGLSPVPAHQPMLEILSMEAVSHEVSASPIETVHQHLLVKMEDVWTHARGSVAKMLSAQ